jgi:hypothetical protein
MSNVGKSPADDFSESIAFANAGALTKEDLLRLGRANLPAVLVAFEQGPKCLEKSQLINDVQWALLQLVREGIGTTAFLRMPHPQVNPQLLVQFVGDLLYPSPSEAEISDDELCYAKQRFGKAHKRIAWRVHRILADRKAARSLASAK